MALCYHGTVMSDPAESCSAVLKKNRGCFAVSGYYWVQCGNMSTPVQVYCDMESLNGGWMRIANENFSNSSVSCPCNWTSTTENSMSYCTVIDNEEQGLWTIDNICPFTEVRGQVSIDQKGSPDAFYTSLGTIKDIDENYVDGVSVTYGTGGTDRQHLFTYAVGVPYDNDTMRSCECQGSEYRDYPRFVQWDFMCDTGYTNSSDFTAVAPRTLFSGEGCETGSGCCHVAGSPWFYKELPQSVSKTLDMRIMADGNHSDEMILIKHVQLFVR